MSDYEIYKKLAVDKTNFIYCSMAVKKCFHLLYKIADGDSRLQLSRLFGFESYNETESTEVLQLADKVYVNSKLKGLNFSALEDFVESLDMGDAYAVDKINNFITEATDGQIRDMLDSLDPESVAVLVSAVHFKDEWKEIMEAGFMNWGDNLKRVSSFIADGLSTKCCKELNKEKGINLVRLQYKSNYSMYVIAGDSDFQLADSLSTNELNNLLDFTNYAGLDEYDEIHLTMPQFNYDSKLSLTSTLKSLGLSSVFDVNNKDFTGVCEDSLYVSDVYHAANIAVTDKGTEASGCVAMFMMRAMGFNVCKTKYISVDKPFTFVIKDDKNGDIIFIGKVSEV